MQPKTGSQGWSYIVVATNAPQFQYTALTETDQYPAIIPCFRFQRLHKLYTGTVKMPAEWLQEIGVFRYPKGESNTVILRHCTMVGDHELHRKLLSAKLQVHMKPALASNVLVNLTHGHNHVY